MNERPQNGMTNISLINYNCSQQLNLNNNQFSVKSTYKQSSCDKIGSTLNNQQNSLSVSLSSTLGTNCNGKFKNKIRFPIWISTQIIAKNFNNNTLIMKKYV